MSSVSKEEDVKKKYSYMQKIKLKNDIEKKLEQKELIEILKILVNNNVKLSQNYTGVLFDLKYVSNDILEKIEKYVEFCSDNRKNQMENDSLKMEYKKELKPESYTYNNSVEDKHPPLSNLYKKYKNIEKHYDTSEIPTYNIENTQTIYKINDLDNKSKKKTTYNKKLEKFNNIVNQSNKKDSIEIDIGNKELDNEEINQDIIDEEYDNQDNDDYDEEEDEDEDDEDEDEDDEDEEDEDEEEEDEEDEDEEDEDEEDEEDED